MKQSLRTLRTLDAYAFLVEWAFSASGWRQKRYERLVCRGADEKPSIEFLEGPVLATLVPRLPQPKDAILGC